MKLDMVGIIVNDMTQALSFYQTLGFNVLGEASPDYTELHREKNEPSWLHCF